MFRETLVLFLLYLSCIFAQVPTINIPPGTCFLVPNGPFSLDSVSSKSSPMTVFRSHFNQAPQVSPNELIFQPPISPGPTIIGSTIDRLLPVNRVTDNQNSVVPKIITQVKEITQEKEATKGGGTSSGPFTGPRNRIFPERPQIPPSVTPSPSPAPSPRPAPAPAPAPAPTRVPSPVSPFTVRTVYRRPASRININGQQFITDGLRASDFTSFIPREQLINSEELEAISQFEAALEESKRAGLYGLRTRNAKKVPSSLPSLPKSPGRLRNVQDLSEVIPPPPVTHVSHDALHLTSSLRDSAAARSIISPPIEKAKSLGDLFNVPSTLEKPKFYQWLEDSSFLMNMQLAPQVNFTVLLPTDDALDSLPPSFIESIESNGTKRRELLFYHIIPGSISIDELQSEDMIPTLLKKKGIRVARGEASHSVSMAGGKLVRERGDLTLSEGKIRFIEIDRLLLPPRGSLWTLISDLPELSIFRNLIIDTGLKEQLDSADATITLFAPNDSAFAAVNSEAASLLTRDRAVARSFLLNHFSSSLLYLSSIPVGSSETIKNIGSQSDLRVERSALNHIRVNDVTVTLADLQATNGVLQVIEQVLLA